MNQRYLLLSTLLVAGAAFAQQRGTVRYALQRQESGGEETSPPAADERAGGDVLFFEDFSNGLAGNNGIGAWTTEGADGALWMYDTDGPNGDFSDLSQRIGAPASFANGFMIFDSNLSNNGCVTTNSCVDREGALVSPLLDLSATPKVVLRYHQRLRWCCAEESPHTVEVSTDGGITWPYTVSAAKRIITNYDPGTQVRDFVLTRAIESNPGNVKVRFMHSATSSHYHWQIDDVRIIESYETDLKTEDAFLSHTGDGLEYGRIPVTQVQPTMLVGGEIVNYGSIDLGNVTGTMNVTGPNPFSAVINTGNLAPGDTAVAQTDQPIPVLGIGTYTGTLTASGDSLDEDGSNNSYVRKFAVTTNTYSIDGIGIHPATAQVTGALGTASFTSNEDGASFMSYYRISEPVNALGIEIRFSIGAPQTVPGGFVLASLLDTAVVLAQPSPVVLGPALVESDPVDVTATAIASGVLYVPFLQPYQLTPNDYFASVKLFSNAGASHIRIADDATVPQPSYASMIHIPNGSQTGVFSNGRSLGVRLRVETPQAIADAADLSGVTVYPILTNGVVNIRTEVAASYTIDVLDLLGQPVLSTRSNGSTTIDLAGQPSGMYMVRVSNGNGTTVQRVTLN